MCKQALPIFGNTYARSSIISLCHCVVQRFDCSLACRDNERCHETVATRVDSAGWLCPAASRGEGRTAASVAEASPSSVLGNPSLTSCASASVADHVKAAMSAQDRTMVMLGGEAAVSAAAAAAAASAVVGGAYSNCCGECTGMGDVCYACGRGACDGGNGGLVMRFCARRSEGIFGATTHDERANMKRCADKSTICRFVKAIKLLRRDRTAENHIKLRVAFCKIDLLLADRQKCPYGAHFLHSSRSLRAMYSQECRSSRNTVIKVTLRKVLPQRPLNRSL